MKKHNKTHSIHVVDIVEDNVITGAKYGTREIVLHTTQKTYQKIR